MPIGDVAVELLGGMLRTIGSIIVEFILEIATRGPGYLLCRMVKRDIAPDGGWVVVVGLAFWAVIGILGYWSIHASLRH